MSFIYDFMGWLGWGSHGGCDDSPATTADLHQSCCCDINPANGLPMGCGGVDVEGNPYGFDFHHNDTWTISSSMDDPFSS